MHVAAGFTPAFSHNQRVFLAVFERGRKARGYASAGKVSKDSIGLPAADEAAIHGGAALKYVWYKRRQVYSQMAKGGF